MVAENDQDLHGWACSWQDKRRQPRHELLPSVPLSLTCDGSGGELVVDLIDISRDGACLAIPTRCNVRVGDGCAVLIPLDEGGRRSRPASVRWRDDAADIAAIGVQFLDLDDPSA